jgi:hypothetical protein
MRGKMHDRIEGVLAKKSFEQWRVAGISDHQLAGGYCGLKSGREVVQRNDRFSAFAQLPHDMAADVSGSAGYEYLIVFHEFVFDVSEYVKYELQTAVRF